jgi:hypothetical protein
MRWLILLGVLSFVGCGGGPTSSTPPAPTSVTSITITPASANVVSGQTKQFSASAAGTGNFNSAVTWSVAGDGTISSSGLFTAGGTTGTATVMVSSVEDPSVINSVPVTVGAIASGLGDWSGTITSANGTQVMPLDFQLVETVAAGGVTYTGGSNGGTVRTYGPLVLQTTSSPSIPCANLFVPTVSKVPGVNSVSGNMNAPGGISLSGTGTGTGVNSGDVSLEVSIGFTANSLETLSLTGQFSPDGSTLSGTYTNTGFQAGCFSSGSSGTFNFSQFTTLSANYSGTFTYGTAGPIPISMAGLSVTIGAIPNVCGSATTVDLLPPAQDGRFFFTVSDNVTQSSLAVWGIVNDTAGQTITIYTTLEGGSQDSPCVSNPVNAGLIEGITLTKQ